MAITNLADLEKAARPLADSKFWDFWQSGANELVTLRENETCFDNYRIRGRALRNVGQLDLTSNQLFGKTYAMPVGIAPCSHHMAACAEGEVATAKACGSSDWPMALSSYSNRTLEDVITAAPSSTVFFQLYVFRNRNTTLDLIKRVEAAGYKAILLTVDTPYSGQRHADKKNKFALPSHITMGNFAGIKVPNPVDQDSNCRPGSSVTEDDNVIDPTLSWEETIPWLKQHTKLQIWVKGIVTAEDTEQAIASGVDGIWVSNHGGRQLDSGLSTIEALPEVVAAAKGRIPIHMDGGVRRGGDIFKALALGADFVWVARPALWGLQYDGQRGVQLMQRLLFEELRMVMALAGTRNVSEIGVNCLMRVWPRPERVYKL